MPTPLTPYEGTNYAYCSRCHSTTVVVIFEEAGKAPISVCEKCLKAEDTAPKETVVEDDEPEIELIIDSGGRLLACKTQSCPNFTNLSCAECGMSCCVRCLDNDDLCPRCVAEYGQLFRTSSRYVH